jgi:DNA-binding GntR family transcriptional regulator
VTAKAKKAIEEAVIEGELAPGTVLVDRQLAASLGVSRTPVRDALRSLEPSGLIRRIERGTQIGWIVSEFREPDIRELFQLRRALEPLAFIEPPVTDLLPELTRLAGFFDDFQDVLSPDDYAAYIERDREFHLEIVKLSMNSRAISYYQILEKQIDRIRHFLAIGYEGRMTQIVVEHGAIYDAMRRGDLEVIADSLKEHLHQGEEAMIEFAQARGLLVDQN